MKSIELLDEELYLSEYNYLRIKEMYDVDNLSWEIDNNKSPVFNNLFVFKNLTQSKIFKTTNTLTVIGRAIRKNQLALQ